MLFQRGAHAGLVNVDTGRRHVAHQLADDVFVTGFLEIGLHHRLGIGIGFFRRQPHLRRRPFTQQAVAARLDAELHLLIMREHIFKGPFAIVESRHAQKPH